MKWLICNESLEVTQHRYGGDWLNVNFNTVKVSTNDKSENKMFYQAFQQLYPSMKKLR